MQSLNPWPVFLSNLEPFLARSLSIQLILKALTDAFAFVKNLAASPPLKGEHIRKEVETIHHELEHLVLFSVENPIAQQGGLIDKIYFYSDVLIQISQVKEPE
ncbi:MAG: hypothetical protein KGI83_07390, partial [Verrucomicrobiota bacterium]|nr:hypothetical protein [Verrucomicrobiota bacterium]